MLNKCAGKDCNRKFKYFGVGLLYAKSTRRKPERPDPELFWLCEKCAQQEHDRIMAKLPVILVPASRRTA